MSKSVSHQRQKHHYLPVFYLKGWAVRDGRLCEYSRPYDRIKPRMKHPAGTGYEYVSMESWQFAVEQRFLRMVDQRAAETREVLLDGRDISALTLDQRSAWSRFEMSLIHRNPEKVAWITEAVEAHYVDRLTRLESQYENIRTPNGPPTFAEYKARVVPKTRETLKAKLLETLADSPNVGAAINGMLWGVATLTDLQPQFLTSDRPVVMTKGIAFPTSYIILPLNPRSAFFATNTSPMLIQLQNALRDGDLMRHINDTVASQAQKLVYFTDDSLEDFIEARLGKFRPQFITSAQYPPYS
jgi:uncharacterized protein DUF4238